MGKGSPVSSPHPAFLPPEDLMISEKVEFKGDQKKGRERSQSGRCVWSWGGDGAGQGLRSVWSSKHHQNLREDNTRTTKRAQKVCSSWEEVK